MDAPDAPVDANPPVAEPNAESDAATRLGGSMEQGKPVKPTRRRGITLKKDI